MSALDKFLDHKYDCSSGDVIRTGDGEIIAGCNCGYDDAAAELAALREEVADLRHQLAHYEVGAEMQIEEEGADNA